MQFSKREWYSPPLSYVDGKQIQEGGAVYGISKLASQRSGVRRVIAYAVSAILASLIYVSYVGCWLHIVQRFVPDAAQVGLGFRILLASFVWLTGGFALTLLLMIVPWTIAIWGYRKLRWSGQIYFSGVGALIVFTLGCTTASISPKPLWIEDQTFLEGAVVAAERQGIGLLLAGIAFGVSYFWLGERPTTPNPD
jgi:hypothetical protein